MLETILVKSHTNSSYTSEIFSSDYFRFSYVRKHFYALRQVYMNEL